MQKIVINKCYGGFGISHEAIMAYAKLSGIKLYAYVNARRADTNFSKYIEYDPKSDESYFCIHYSSIPYEESNDINKGYFSTHDIKRDDPILIKVVEELGEAAAGRHAKLKIVEIPDGVVWELDEYDGMESIDEVHQSWG
jgi:hypothetical protein